MSSSNYMLNVCQYKKKEDLYSCGGCFTSLCYEFAINRVCAPKTNYADGCSVLLSEQYRWIAIQSRLLHIFCAAHFFKTGKVSETMVQKYQLHHRDHLFRMGDEIVSWLKLIKGKVIQQNGMHLNTGHGRRFCPENEDDGINNESRREQKDNCYKEWAESFRRNKSERFKPLNASFLTETVVTGSS